MSVIPLGSEGTAISNRDLVSEMSTANSVVAVAIGNRGSCPLVRQRKRSVKRKHSIPQRMQLLDVRMIRKSFCDEIRDLLDVFFFHPPSRNRWSPDADAGWFHRAAGVEGDAVFVDGDAGFVEGV
jgi:hypothetical protein